MSFNPRYKNSSTTPSSSSSPSSSRLLLPLDDSLHSHNHRDHHPPTTSAAPACTIVASTNPCRLYHLHHLNRCPESRNSRITIRKRERKSPSASKAVAATVDENPQSAADAGRQ
ncbi:hypothetical protein Dimus_019755 [Dionaea muscipula]